MTVNVTFITELISWFK